MAEFDIRYRWQTTALNEIIFRDVEAPDEGEAMEKAFEDSGHDDREAFLRDLEPVSEEDSDYQNKSGQCEGGVRVMALVYNPYYNGPIHVGDEQNAARVIPFKYVEVGQRFRWSYHDPSSDEESPVGSRSPLMVKTSARRYRHIEGGGPEGRTWEGGALTGCVIEEGV